MTHFRQRLATVEAVQWTGDNFTEVVTFAGDVAVTDEEGGTLVIGEEPCPLNHWLVRHAGTLTVWGPEEFPSAFDPID
jgi:hypothetical protein